MWVLAFFIGGAMVALIIVQYYWIQNAIEVKDKQFGQHINRMLTNVSYEIEKQETVSQVLDELKPLRLNRRNQSNGTYYRFDTLITDSNRHFSLHQNISVFHNGESSSKVKYYTIFGNDTFVKPLAQRQGNQQFDSIFPDDSTVDLSEAYYNQLLERRQFVDDVVNRMFSFERDITERIKPEVVEKAIQQTFNDRGIDLDFEYAVTRNYNEIAFHSEHFKRSDKIDYFKTRLFTDDFISSNNFLYVYFPDKKNFLFKSLGFMSTSSIILTLIVIISFVVSLLIIFRQKKLSEIKNDFISNMTHELKTPISTISLATQMLQDQSIPVESKNVPNISGIIADESKRLGYQVEKVLQMATLDKGKLKFRLKDMDVHEIIQSATKNFSIQLKNRNGDIKTLLNADHTSINGDAVHITNVFSNLIDNAIKYSPDAPDITITTENKNGYIIIAVNDKGLGISKDNQKRIFEKFYRVPTGNLHNVKGFGLGLSYVKMIVEMHKGHIKIDSELNKGTTIFISLPIKH